MLSVTCCITNRNKYKKWLLPICGFTWFLWFWCMILTSFRLPFIIIIIRLHRRIFHATQNIIVQIEALLLLPYYCCYCQLSVVGWLLSVHTFPWRDECNLSLPAGATCNISFSFPIRIHIHIHHPWDFRSVSLVFA